MKQGVVPATMWFHQEAGHNGEAKNELRAVLGESETFFITPKPTRLIKRILEIATDRDSLILDSFAGSGTTGQAVLTLNRQDGGTRRFILVEMEETICRSITAQRLTRAVKGYAPRGAVASISDRRDDVVASISDRRDEKAFSYRRSEIDATTEENRRSETAATSHEGKSAVEGLGGGFRYCGLGEPLFDEAGNVCRSVRFPDLAAHVFFTETGAPIPQRATGKTPLLGEYNGKAVYLLFNGVMGDKSAHGGNVLTNETLKSLPEVGSRRVEKDRRSETAATVKDMVKVVYGEGCRLGAARLKREGIIFKQVPYEIKVS